MEIKDVYYVLKKGTKRVVNRYVLAEDFKCKYCGSTASIRKARDSTAVIVSGSLLVTSPCPRCEVLLITLAMLCNPISVVCLLTKSSKIWNSNTIIARR